VLVRVETFFVAQLRFSEHATIQPHAGDNDTIVVCVEGEGSRPSETRRQPYARVSRCAGRKTSSTASGRRRRP